MRNARQDLSKLLRTTARPLGFLMMVLAALMLACAAVGGLFQQGWEGLAPLLISAIITLATGILFGVFIGRKARKRLGRREAILVVSISWILAGFFGGLPFVIGAGFPVHDAFFETISGFTTTGATIMTSIEGQLSAPLHLWRLFTHWLGGLGLVLLFVAIFPALGVGGKHLFRSEVPGPRPQGLVPRIRETASALWRIYVLITVLETFLLVLAGLSPFEALAHSFSTMGTGGFSTLDTSVGGFDSALVEMVILVFMLVAGTNFGLFYDVTRRGWRVLFQNPEFRYYLGIYAVVTIIVVIDILPTQGGVLESLRHGSFQVATVMTTTGFGTDDFDLYPTLSKVLLICMYFVGGSAGSTAGGMKVIRVAILFKALLVEVRRTHRPNLVAPVMVGRQPFSPQAIVEVAAFCGVFCATVLGGAAVVAMLDQVDLITAFMASLACLANVGPGLGLVGPTHNYAFFSPATKYFLSALMLLGRLEFFTLLALLNPRFWSR